MCGRFTNRLTWKHLREIYGITEPEIGPGEPEPELRPRYNIAPTQDVPVVRQGPQGGRELAPLRWGLIPAWAKDAEIGTRLINAKAETVAEKPSFRAAFKRRRCLVPADGFYEWQVTKEGKQPWLIGLTDGAPFAMAGLWERWEKGDALAGEAPVIESFTIITCPPNDLTGRLYNRMPVILDASDHEAWLTSPDTAIPLALLQPYPAERMAAFPVTRRVNSPRHDDAGCVEAADAEIGVRERQAAFTLQ